MRLMKNTDKKTIDKIYECINKEPLHEPFAISLPILLINKSLYNETEEFYKSNYDLLHSDLDVLYSLYFENDTHSLTPTQLYEALIFSSGGMTKVLKKLEDRKLIRRDSCKNDKRKSFVVLTQAGIDIVEVCVEKISKKFQEHFKVLTKKEQDTLKKLLKKLLLSMS